MPRRLIWRRIGVCLACTLNGVGLKDALGQSHGLSLELGGNGSWVFAVTAGFVLGFAAMVGVVLVTSLGDRLRVIKMMAGRRRGKASWRSCSLPGRRGSRDRVVDRSSNGTAPLGCSGALEKLREKDSASCNIALATYYFNPTRDPRIRAAYLRLFDELEALSLPTFVVEVAFPGESFPSGKAFLRVTADESNALWQKDRIINILVAEMPDEIEVVVWVDPGVQLLYPSWVDRAREVVKHVEAAQLFEHALVVNQEGRVCAVVASSGGRASVTDFHTKKAFWSDGAWVARRSAFPLSERFAAMEVDASIDAVGRTESSALTQPNKMDVVSRPRAAWRSPSQGDDQGVSRASLGQVIARISALPKAITPLCSKEIAHCSKSSTGTELVEHPNGLLSVPPGCSKEVAARLRELCAVVEFDRYGSYRYDELPKEFRTSSVGVDA